MSTLRTAAMEWHNKQTDDPRWRYRSFVHDENQVGHVEWFTDRPTAYGYGPAGRLGVFTSAGAAMSAVERAVAIELGVQPTAPTYSRENPPPYPDVPSDAARELCIDAFRRLLDGQLSGSEYNRVVASAH